MSSHMAWEHINTSLWLPIIEMSDGQVRGLTTNGLGSHVGKPAPAKCSYDFFISILATLDWNVRRSSKRIDHLCCGWASLLQIIRQLQEYNKKTVWEHLCRLVRTSQSTFDSCPVHPQEKSRSPLQPNKSLLTHTIHWPTTMTMTNTHTKTMTKTQEVPRRSC